MDKLPKSYKKLSRKKLRSELLRQMNDNIFIVSENYSLNKENGHMRKERAKTNEHLWLAENALAYKELVIDKYKKLLETSVEDL